MTRYYSVNVQISFCEWPDIILWMTRHYCDIFCENDQILRCCCENYNILIRVRSGHFTGQYKLYFSHTSNNTVQCAHLLVIFPLRKLMFWQCSNLGVILPSSTSTLTFELSLALLSNFPTTHPTSHPPTQPWKYKDKAKQTICSTYLSCYWPDFDQNLKVPWTIWNWFHL